jgi:glycosyltransferase involved in cell wall biosynthesis
VSRLSEQQARVAVVIPCYNDGATVGDTVASVREQEPCELVVVNDGSTDETTLGVLKRLEDEGVMVVHQENSGLSAARNAGVGATTAPYVYPLDADDKLAPGALTALADALDAHPELAVVWGFTRAFGESTHMVTHAPHLDPWRVTFFNQLPYSALFRRSAVEEVGGWALKGGYEDWELWMKLAEGGFQGRRVPIVATRYRVHGSRMWSEAVARHEEIVSVLRERHPSLFGRRRVNWRRSQSSWPVKLGLPAVDALPTSYRNKRRLYLVLTQPRLALAMVGDRLRRRGP